MVNVDRQRSLPFLKGLIPGTQILAGACIVFLACALTISSGYPRWYAPFSLPVVIPAMLLDVNVNLSNSILVLVAPIPIVTLYLAWSFLLGRSRTIGKASRWLAVFFLALSFVWYCLGILQGIDYQGSIHTLLMIGFSLVFLGVLSLIFMVNRQNPSRLSAQFFHIVLFTWLGWVSFPWLGELP